MAKNTTTFTFRPQVNVLNFWSVLRRLCKERDISISELLNSVVPAIAAELAKQPKNRQFCYEFNLGLIKVDSIQHAKD